MKKIALLIGLILIISCKKENVLKKYNAIIIEQSFEERSSSKTNICVRIPKGFNTNILHEISEYLYNQFKNENYYKEQDRLYITYLLPNMKNQNFGWANVEYTPKYKIEINGISEKDKNVLLKIKPPKNTSKIFDKWYNNRPRFESSIILSKVEHEFILKSLNYKGKVIDFRKVELDTISYKKIKLNYEITNSKIFGKPFFDDKEVKIDEQGREYYETSYENKAGEYFLLDTKTNLLTLNDSLGVIFEYYAFE